MLLHSLQYYQLGTWYMVTFINRNFALTKTTKGIQIIYVNLLIIIHHHYYILLIISI